MKIQNNLGDIASTVKTYFVERVKQFVADYQAKLGRFMLLKQKLYELQAKAGNLPQSLNATSLMADIQNAISVQENLEMQGFAVIDVLNKIKADPVVQDALKGKYPDVLEFEKWTLLQGTLNNVNNVAGVAQQFFGATYTQEQTVANLSDRLTQIQTGKAPIIGSGFKLNLASIPASAYTIGLAVLFFGFKIFWTVRKPVRRRVR